MDGALEGPLQTRDVQSLAPEIIALVLSHTEDVSTLRACSLVCFRWAALARPYLFRKVVCLPGVPLRTWDDLSRFLSTSPDVTRHIRWLTVDGAQTVSRYILPSLVLESIFEALECLPSLTRLYIRCMTFKNPTSDTEAMRTAFMHSTRLRERRLSLEVLSVHTCFLYTLMPLHLILASIAHIGRFAMYRFTVFDSLPRLPGPVNVRIDAIDFDGRYPLNRHFWETLGQCLAPGAASGLSFSTGFVPRRVATANLSWVFPAFHMEVQSVSVNVLRGSCDLCDVVSDEDAQSFDPGSLSESVRPYDSPEFPRIDLSPFVSIRRLVLYFTTTSVQSGLDATRLYACLLENNWSLLSNAPTSLAHIELHFQRYGAHTQSTLDELRAIDETAFNPGQVRWSTVDAGTLTRFSNLEAFTCVLCDGGFLDQFQMPANPVASIVARSREREYHDYVGLLAAVFPRLNGSRLLRFKMWERTR